MITLLTRSAFLLVLIPVISTAEFVSVWPEEEPNITGAIASRTSINVRSIEESLILYEGILGMTPFYERKGLKDPRLISFSGLKPDQQMRLVVLRTETDVAAKLNAGYIGLSEILDSDGNLVEQPEHIKNAAVYGSIALLFVVEDVMSTYEKVIDAGFEVISAPKARENGSHTQLLIRGPSGERLWITESEKRTAFLEEKI